MSSSDAGEDHLGFLELLQTLAVLGKEFALSLVRAVTGRGDDELNRMLDALQLAELIYEQPAAGEVEYTFKHALTQEVAYHSVLSERRLVLFVGFVQKTRPVTRKP